MDCLRCPICGVLSAEPSPVVKNSPRNTMPLPSSFGKAANGLLDVYVSSSQNHNYGSSMERPGTNREPHKPVCGEEKIRQAAWSKDVVAKRGPGTYQLFRISHLSVTQRFPQKFPVSCSSRSISSQVLVAIGVGEFAVTFPRQPPPISVSPPSGILQTNITAHYGYGILTATKLRSSLVAATLLSKHYLAKIMVLTTSYAQRNNYYNVSRVLQIIDSVQEILDDADDFLFTTGLDDESASTFQCRSNDHETVFLSADDNDVDKKEVEDEEELRSLPPRSSNILDDHGHHDESSGATTTTPRHDHDDHDRRHRNIAGQQRPNSIDRAMTVPLTTMMQHHWSKQRNY